MGLAEEGTNLAKERWNATVNSAEINLTADWDMNIKEKRLTFAFAIYPFFRKTSYEKFSELSPY